MEWEENFMEFLNANPKAPEPERRSPLEESNARSEELFNTIIRNIEVARINLQDTPYSADRLLLCFYEATAMSVRRHVNLPERALPAPDDLDGGPASRYDNAAALLEDANGMLRNTRVRQAKEYKFLRSAVVGFHSRYNLLVLKHNRRVLDAAATNSEREKIGFFEEQASSYDSLITDIKELCGKSQESFPGANIQSKLRGVNVAAHCGLMSCLCEQANIQSTLPGGILSSLVNAILSTESKIKEEMDADFSIEKFEDRKAMRDSIQNNIDALTMKFRSYEL